MKKKSKALTTYNTPKIEVARILIQLENMYPDFLKRKLSILEPSAGAGNVASAVRRRLPNKKNKLTLIELNHKFRRRLSAIDNNATLLCPQDYLAWETGRKFDLIIGNPPYGSNIESEFVLKALTQLKYAGLLVFLLKLSFLESKKRYELIFENPKNQLTGLMALARRIPFDTTKGTQTDKYSYAWCVWQNVHNPRQWCRIVNNPPLPKGRGAYVAVKTSRKPTLRLR